MNVTCYDPKCPTPNFTVSDSQSVPIIHTIKSIIRYDEAEFLKNDLELPIPGKFYEVNDRIMRLFHSQGNRNDRNYYIIVYCPSGHKNQVLTSRST